GGFAHLRRDEIERLVPRHAREDAGAFGVGAHGGMKNAFGAVDTPIETPHFAADVPFGRWRGRAAVDLHDLAALDGDREAAAIRTIERARRRDRRMPPRSWRRRAYVIHVPHVTGWRRPGRSSGSRILPPCVRPPSEPHFRGGRIMADAEQAPKDLIGFLD